MRALVVLVALVLALVASPLLAMLMQGMQEMQGMQRVQGVQGVPMVSTIVLAEAAAAALMRTVVSVESEILLLEVTDASRVYEITIVGVPVEVLESATLRVSARELSHARTAPLVTFQASASTAASRTPPAYPPIPAANANAAARAAATDDEDETDANGADSDDEEDEDEDADNDDDEDDEEDANEHAKPTVRDVDNDRDRAATAAAAAKRSSSTITVEPFVLDPSLHPPPTGLQPLVMLVMIVKNEIAGLRTTLLSTYGHVDRYCILDTGSTDGTLEIIRAFYAALPDPSHGRLFHEPFVDFSTTRNRLLALAGQETEFVLMLNGDDRLQGGPALRTFLESKRGLTALDEAIYIMPVNYGDVSEGRSERLARTINHAVPSWPNDDWNHWRFEGVTHEVYVCNKALHGGARIIYTDGTFSIYHDISSDTKESKRRRFELDVELLQREIRDHPDRPNYARSVYYLAQSYYNLQRAPEAYKWYSERVKVNYPRPTKVGEDNEKARSYLMLADLAPRIGQGSAVAEKHLKKSYKLCPNAYALFQLAKLYARDGDVEKGIKMAESGINLARRGSAVVCAGDDQLVLQHAPPLLAHMKKSVASKSGGGAK